MKTFIISTLILLFSLVQTSFAANQTQLTKNISKYQKAQNKSPLLYVLSGGSAQIKILNKLGKRYKLTISNVSSNMIYFSNRPSRLAGFIPMTYFLEQWGKGADSFAKNPPNAALEAVSGKDTYSFIFELSQPTYHAKQQQLSFNVKLLQGNAQYLQKDINSVDLFIDFHWHGGLP